MVSLLALPEDRVKRARVALALFLAVTFPLAWWVEGLILARAWTPMKLVFILMWVPAVASFAVRLVLREGFSDVSFRFGGWAGLKACLLAWAFPLAVGGAAYGAAWALGWGSFQPFVPKGQPPAHSPAVIFALLVGQALTTGFLFNAVYALGEEVGWRGWMQLRLMEAGVPRPVLVGSLIWCVWHFPLFLFGRGPLRDRVLFVAIFTVAIVPISYLLSWLRFRYGTVWPAVVLHGSWNSVIDEAFDMSSDGPTWLLGEGGILVAAVNWVLVALLVRGVWSLKRRPAEEPFLRIEGWKL